MLIKGKFISWRGALDGMTASIVLIAASLALRAWLGVATLPELIGDRLAPLLGIPVFFKLLNIMGGYSHLKQVGVGSVLLAELVAGAAVGLLHARFMASRRLHRARALTSALVGAATLLLIVGVWPNLATNYSGFPPERATSVSILALFGLSAIFVIVLLFLSEWKHEIANAQSDVVNGRRALLTGITAGVAALISTVFLARFYRIATYAYDGTENKGEDLPPVTPNDKFYQVTKNNVDPRPSLERWALQVDGSLSNPRLLHRQDLQTMATVEQETTLQCISNSIGGGLNSNAWWKGVPLREVLAAAGISPFARQVMFHGADGFTDDLPIEKALHPQTLLVFEMNGKELPQKHGFPVRLIVPGFVGEKSVKWLTRIEVREHPGKGFYEQQGWGPQFTINNSARFDAPDFNHPLRVGQRTVIKGTAFAGDRGVRVVQVSTDGGKTWAEAEITYRGSDLAWVQWRFPWKPEVPGKAMLAVRCIDGDGKVQDEKEKSPGPEPARGYQQITATIQA